MNVESESSLPTTFIDSSPPPGTQYSLAPMDNVSSKSEPIALQNVQQVQDVQQTPDRKHMNSDDTERPVSAQRERGDGAEEHENIEINQAPSDDDDDADPSEQISHFDWDELHQEYHAAIKQFNDEENQLMEEWEGLMTYFRVWASSGHAHETDRTFQRLKTRTEYVQNEEDELEQRRIHYVSVVRAFESALNLLKTSTMIRG